MTPDPCEELFLSSGIYNNQNSWLTAPFSLIELNHCLKNSNNFAPGLDNIQYSMLYNLAPSAKYLLLDTINDVFKQGIFIPEWSTQVVIPILKSEKDPNKAESYRPIALSSCISKTYERLLKIRLDWFLEKNNILPSYHHAYRKGIPVII